MKYIYLLLITFYLTACTKSIYYAYEYEDQDNISYCTIEITQKKEIIYRAYSSEYWKYNDPKNNQNLYVYIHSGNKSSTVSDESIHFVCDISHVAYIKNSSNTEYENCLANFSDSFSCLVYGINKSDTITKWNYSKAEDFAEYAKGDICFLKEAGIKWFPPYMVKVNEIDYKKFSPRLQHMNLKDPKKSYNYSKYDFTSDLFVVYKKSKYGFANNKFKIIVPLKYSLAHQSFHNYLPVKKKDKWGVIDTNQNIVIPFMYDNVAMVQESNDSIRIVAKKNGQEALLDIHNNPLTPFKYEYIGERVWKDEFLWVATNDQKQGYINLQGKEIVPPLYEDITTLTNYDVFFVKKDNKWKLLDLKGNVVSNIEYDSLIDDSHYGIILTKDNKKYYSEDRGLTFKEI